MMILQGFVSWEWLWHKWPCSPIFRPLNTMWKLSLQVVQSIATNKVCEGYVFTSICHSVHRGVSVSVHAGIHTPIPGTRGRHLSPEQTPPRPELDTPRARGTHPQTRDRHPFQGRHPPGQTLWEQTPPRSRHPPSTVHAGRYGQQASGAHPTGMHTCFFSFSKQISEIKK